MKASTARRIGWLRQVVLALSLACFVFIFLSAGSPALPRWISSGGYFAFDPLILLQRLIHARPVFTLALLALVPVALALLCGKAFCGWICPFGALHEFFTWITEKGRTPRTEPDRFWLRAKYLILVFLVAASVVGTDLFGWWDPLSWLSRSGAAAVTPAASNFLAAKGSAPRFSVAPVLIGSLFLLVIGLNAWRKRFFCNALCPLGALFGLIARVGLWHLRDDGSCSGCGACARRCPYDGGAGPDFRAAECIACLRCVQDCPGEGVEVALEWPWRRKDPGIDLGRRRLFGTVAAGVAFGLLPLGAAETRAKSPRRFVRPPGAVRERDFLERCVRCGQCMQACPTSFIQPASLEASFVGLWTPVVNCSAGYCDYSCNRCTQVCPTGAIQPLSLAQKQTFKIGTATIDKNRCFTHSDGFNCTVCVDRCPIPEKPLRFREVEMMDFRGRQVRVRQLYVVPDLCTGCGICEYACPRSGGPGITITPEDEVREAVGQSDGPA